MPCHEIFINEVGFIYMTTFFCVENKKGDFFTKSSKTISIFEFHSWWMSSWNDPITWLLPGTGFEKFPLYPEEFYQLLLPPVWKTPKKSLNSQTFGFWIFFFFSLLLPWEKNRDWPPYIFQACPSMVCALQIFQLYCFWVRKISAIHF